MPIQPRNTRPRGNTGLTQAASLRNIYFSIIGLLPVLVLALVGGIIWYNSKKTNELVIAAAERLIVEIDEKILDRLKLLYEPIYATVRLGSEVPDLTSPSIKDDPNTKAIFLRGLRTYPQIRSLYVGFDNGEFFMITRITGDAGKPLRARLSAPQDAEFANQIISADADGKLKERWISLADDGRVVGQRDTVPNFDPRLRPWYKAAKRSESVERSEPYVFASSNSPGVTLSRSFTETVAGVIGADLSMIDLAQYLREQSITETSISFIFTTTGDIVVAPGITIADTAASESQITAAPAKITDTQDPVMKSLADAYKKNSKLGSGIYDVAGRTYIGHISSIPPRYGSNELLAIMVPLDEILSPVIELRNQTLFYSLAFLVFALPLYITIVVHLIDRRLERHTHWFRRDDEY
jgi:adenylate cyclase